MVIELHPHRRQPAQDLFCRAGNACDRTPAIPLTAKDTFTAHFAADFAAAMTERRHENDTKTPDAA